jgi:lysophospholipid acyltransferase (LPLAT)-like uncharacterized protein
MARRLSDISARMLSQKAGLSVAHHGLTAAVRTVLLTVKVRVEGVEAVDEAMRSGPVIFAFWHGKQMPLLAFKHNWRLATLVSHSKDGELLARILRDFGHTIVRGSSSRGGSEGFQGLADAMRKGFNPCFATDGPRGPLRMSKPGPVRLAAMTGRPLIPASAAASRHATLGTWDRMEVPSPFSTVAVAFGRALVFRADISADELYSATVITSAAIDQCTLRAEQMAGGL